MAGDDNLTNEQIAIKRQENWHLLKETLLYNIFHYLDENNKKTKYKSSQEECRKVIVFKDFLESKDSDNCPENIDTKSEVIRFIMQNDPGLLRIRSNYVRDAYIRKIYRLFSDKLNKGLSPIDIDTYLDIDPRSRDHRYNHYLSNNDPDSLASKLDKATSKFEEVENGEKFTSALRDFRYKRIISRTHEKLQEQEDESLFHTNSVRKRRKISEDIQSSIT